MVGVSLVRKRSCCCREVEVAVVVGSFGFASDLDLSCLSVVHSIISDTMCLSVKHDNVSDTVCLSVKQRLRSAVVCRE